MIWDGMCSQEHVCELQGRVQQLVRSKAQVEQRAAAVLADNQRLARIVDQLTIECDLLRATAHSSARHEGADDSDLDGATDSAADERSPVRVEREVVRRLRGAADAPEVVCSSAQQGPAPNSRSTSRGEDMPQTRLSQPAPRHMNKTPAAPMATSRQLQHPQQFNLHRQSNSTGAIGAMGAVGAAGVTMTSPVPRLT